MSTTIAPRPAPPPTTPRRRNPAPALLRRYVPLTLLGLVFISPLLFMLVTSFKSRQEASAVPPTWIPTHPTTDA